MFSFQKLNFVSNDYYEVISQSFCLSNIYITCIKFLLYVLQMIKQQENRCKI